MYAAWIRWYGPLLLRRWPESDKDRRPLLKSLTTCHIGLGLSHGEQNLLLCETAQVAKSCLFPSLPAPPWVTRLWQRLEPVSQWHRNLLPWLVLQPILEETLCVGFWALSCCAKELPHPGFFRPSCQGTTDLLITDTDIETKQSLLCSVCSVAPRGFFSAGRNMPLHFVLSSPKPPTGAASIHSQEEKAEMRQILAVECCCYLSFLSPIMG